MRTLIVAVSLATMARAQSVRVTDRYERYVIHGASTEALVAQMEALGPHEGDDAAPALTRSDRRASMTYQGDGHGCRTSDVTVTLDVTIILPVWDIPRDASTVLRREWDRFLGALERHEQGHRAIAVAGARKLADALRLLNGRSCSALHTAAEYASRDVAAATRAEQIAYDDSTRHGLTQGTALANVR
jgi:predicted secreted Zn-dependent protease